MDAFPSLEQRFGPCYYSRARKVPRVTLVLMICSTVLGCGASRQPSGPDPALADTLKRVIETAYDFTRPGIVQRMSALYPDTGRVISASGGQIITTADSVRKGIAAFWQNVGHNMQNPKWQWDSVYVDRLGQDVAVMTAKWSIPHIAPNNQPHVITGAWTAVFRRINGQWKIVQEHLSSG
jgi:ketosteroid isomerase-like protein